MIFIDVKGGVIMLGFINMYNYIYSIFVCGLSLMNYYFKNFMDILVD